MYLGYKKIRKCICETYLHTINDLAVGSIIDYYSKGELRPANVYTPALIDYINAFDEYDLDNLLTVLSGIGLDDSKSYVRRFDVSGFDLTDPKPYGTIILIKVNTTDDRFYEFDVLTPLVDAKYIRRFVKDNFNQYRVSISNNNGIHTNLMTRIKIEKQEFLIKKLIGQVVTMEFE